MAGNPEYRNGALFYCWLLSVGRMRRERGIEDHGFRKAGSNTVD
jgi:hypothetical protein